MKIVMSVSETSFRLIPNIRAYIKWFRVLFTAGTSDFSCGESEVSGPAMSTHKRLTSNVLYLPPTGGGIEIKKKGGYHRHIVRLPTLLQRAL